MLKKGDFVKVVNAGQNYSAYIKFFKQEGCKEFEEYYTVNNSKDLLEEINKCNVFEVVYIQKLDVVPQRICVIANSEYDKVFLVREDGLQNIWREK